MAEWRALRFNTMDTVQLKTWKVIVIRICCTPFRVVSLNPPTVYGNANLPSYEELQNSINDLNCQFMLETVIRLRFVLT